MKISFRVILGIVYILLIAVIGVLAVFTYRTNSEYDADAHLVQQTHYIIEVTHEISSLYKDIQLQSNSYIVTGDDQLLRSYAAGKRRLSERMDVIRSLTSDNPAQQTRLDSLARRIANLIRYTDSGFFDSTNGSDQKAIAARLVRSTELRAPVQGIITSIRNEEIQLLQRREAQYESAGTRYIYTYSTLLLGMAILVGMSFLIVRNNYNRRLEMQTELQRANELFVKLFEESPVAGLLCRTHDLAVISCNKRYTELVGSTKAEIQDKQPVFLNSVSKEQLELISSIAKSEQNLYDLEIKFEDSQKGTRWLELSMQAVDIQDEKYTRFTIKDVTAHKRAELEIRSALDKEMKLSRMKSDFVTLASHEFRTPLTSIVTSARLIEKIPSGDPGRLLKHVERIKSSVGTLASILDNFLLASAIEEGHVEARPEKFDIKSLVSRVCDRIQSSSATNRKLVFTHSGTSEVFLDRSMVDVIVSQLVNNAMKYSSEDAQVKVSTSLKGGLELSVIDTGIGIPEDEQRNLFERFYRATNSGNVPGAGLGLYIAKSYARKLNGVIRVQSELGKGSNFCVMFQDAAA